MAGIVANKVRKAREKESYDAKDKTEMVRIVIQLLISRFPSSPS